MSEYESIVLVKPEVFVYRIPPIGAGGHKAADWKLDEPNWTGRLRLVAAGSVLEVRLEDKSTGQLFAKCPVDAYPGKAVETVTDSSRYFVLRLVNDNGQTAFIGIGFADRADSFDLNVALMDHFKYISKKEECDKQTEEADAGPKLDLGFKEGQTITINLGVSVMFLRLEYADLQGHYQSSSRSRPTSATTGGPVPLLPPPPGGSRAQKAQAAQSGTVEGQ